MTPKNALNLAPNVPLPRKFPLLLFKLPVDILPLIFKHLDDIDLINFTSLNRTAARLPKYLFFRIGHLFIVHNITGLYYIVWETMKINFDVDEEKYNNDYLLRGRTRMIRDVRVGFHTETGRLRNRNAKFDFIVCKTREEREKVFRYVVQHVYQLTREGTLIEFHSAGLAKENILYIFDIIQRFHKVYILLPSDMNADDLRMLLTHGFINDLCLDGPNRDLGYYTGDIKPTSLAVTNASWLSAHSLLYMETKYFFAGNTHLNGRDIKNFLEAWKRGILQNVTTMCITKDFDARIRNYNSAIVRGLDAEPWHAPFVRNDINRSVFQPDSTWCFRNVSGVLAMVRITPMKINFRVWNLI